LTSAVQAGEPEISVDDRLIAFAKLVQRQLVHYVPD